MASVDTATLLDEAAREAEDQIGLNKATRREVQWLLTRLGFHTIINDKFDETTRGAITRWQEGQG